MDSIAPDIPTRPNRLTPSGLGRIIQQFPLHYGRLTGWVLAILSVTALAGAGLVLILSLILVYSRYYRFGPALALKDIPIPLLLVLCLSVIGILAARQATLIWNKRIILHANGLVILNRRGAHTWRWEEITALQATVNRQYAFFFYTGTGHRYTLYKAGGDHLVLDDSFEQVEILGDAIRSRLFPRLLDQNRQLYQAGKRVPFGQISINQTAGLRLGNEVYSWQTVKSAGILDGHLVINIDDGRRSKTLRIRGDKLRNPDVLLTLLSEIIPTTNPHQSR